MDLNYDQICKLVGRLYLQSQLELDRLASELVKTRNERDQALELIKGQKDVE